MGKKADKDARRAAQAERKNAPVHLLVAINTMCPHLQYGLHSGKVVSGVKVPALHLPPAQAKWCRQQLAKIVRWTAVNMERYGFSFSGRISVGLWRTGGEKIHLIGSAIQHYAPTCGYENHVIIQLIVAETAWIGVRVQNHDTSREAAWLSQTLDTFTSRFTDGEDEISRWATDVYMAIGPMLNGTETVRAVDFNNIPAWCRTA